MLKAKEFLLREKPLRIIGVVVVALILSVIYSRPPGFSLFEKFLMVLGFTAIFWSGCVSIFFFFRRRFPKISQTPKRLLYTVLVSVIFVVLVDPLLCLITGSRELHEFLLPGVFFERAGGNLLVTLVIGSIYENAFFYENWQKTVYENEQLRTQQIRTQFEVMQNQMSPHFLFNSLNTLTTLITEDAALAASFTEKLSEVYRYILQNKERELVSLADEIEFVKNYVFLLQIRYPENLLVEFKIDTKVQQLQLPPLTLQMLIENATKHNVISKASPLYVDIYSEGDKAIVIKNSLQPRRTVEKSTKTGLTNIRKRYNYFGNKNIELIRTAQSYIVVCPLLKVKLPELDWAV